MAWSAPSTVYKPLTLVYKSGCENGSHTTRPFSERGCSRRRRRSEIRTRDSAAAANPAAPIFLSGIFPLRKIVPERGVYPRVFRGGIQGHVTRATCPKASGPPPQPARSPPGDATRDPDVHKRPRHELSGPRRTSSHPALPHTSLSAARGEEPQRPQENGKERGSLPYLLLPP